MAVKLLCQIKDKLDKIILVMLAALLTVDSVNGVLLRCMGMAYVSQAFKFLLLMLLALRIRKWVKTRYTILASFLTAFYCLLCVYRGEFFKISMVLRFLLLVLCFIYTQRALARKIVSAGAVYIVIAANYFVIAINILLGLMGFGLPTYAADIGYKGLFFAGNPVSLVFFILGFMLLLLLWRLGPRLFILGAAINFGLALFLATKTAVIGSLLGALVIPALNAKITTKWVAITAGIFALLAPLLYFYSIQSGLWQRWASAYVNIYNNSFLSVVLSGRGQLLSKGWRQYTAAPALVILFGAAKQCTVEMDFFDGLFNLGVVGLLLVSFGFYVLYRSLATNRNKALLSSLVFLNVTMLAISFISGHVVFSAMVTPLWGVANALFCAESVGLTTLRFKIFGKEYPKSPGWGGENN